MSNKSARTVKKNPIPRALADIQAEYNQRALGAGQLQYQILVYEKELVKLNDDLLRLNHEANARKQLDEAQATPETSKEA